jgi:hypothetical protein
VNSEQFFVGANLVFALLALGVMTKIQADHHQTKIRVNLTLRTKFKKWPNLKDSYGNHIEYLLL